MEVLVTLGEFGSMHFGADWSAATAPAHETYCQTRALILHLLFLALSNPAQYPFVPPP